jgi:hypothetical protein
MEFPSKKPEKGAAHLPRARVMFSHDQIARTFAKQEKYMSYYNAIDRKIRANVVNSADEYSFPKTSKKLGVGLHGGRSLSRSGNFVGTGGDGVQRRDA